MWKIYKLQCYRSFFLPPFYYTIVVICNIKKKSFQIYSDIHHFWQSQFFPEDWVFIWYYLMLWWRTSFTIFFFNAGLQRIIFSYKIYFFLVGILLGIDFLVNAFYFLYSTLKMFPLCLPIFICPIYCSFHDVSCFFSYFFIFGF